MSPNKTILIISSLIFSITVYSQTKQKHIIVGRQYAENVLKEALLHTSQNGFPKSKSCIIKDSSSAIAIAEPILFKTYSKPDIKSERPYEIYHIDHYWVLMGTLPKEMKGGTFLIILNDKNAQIIVMAHGK